MSVDAPEARLSTFKSVSKVKHNWLEKEPVWITGAPVESPEPEKQYSPADEEIFDSAVWRSEKPIDELHRLEKMLRQARAQKLADSYRGIGVKGLEDEIESIQKAIAIAKEVSPQRQAQLEARKIYKSQKPFEELDSIKNQLSEAVSQREENSEKGLPVKDLDEKIDYLTRAVEIGEELGPQRQQILEKRRSKLKDREQNSAKQEFLREARKFINKNNLPEIREELNKFEEKDFQKFVGSPFHRFAAAAGLKLNATGHHKKAASAFEHAFRLAEQDEAFGKLNRLKSYESAYAEQWVSTVHQMYSNAYHMARNEHIKNGAILDDLSPEELDKLMYNSPQVLSFFAWFRSKRLLLDMMTESIVEEKEKLKDHPDVQTYLNDQLAKIQELLNFDFWQAHS